MIWCTFWSICGVWDRPRNPNIQNPDEFVWLASWVHINSYLSAGTQGDEENIALSPTHRIRRMNLVVYDLVFWSICGVWDRPRNPNIQNPDEFPRMCYALFMRIVTSKNRIKTGDSWSRPLDFAGFSGSVWSPLSQVLKKLTGAENDDTHISVNNTGCLHTLNSILCSSVLCLVTKKMWAKRKKNCRHLERFVHLAFLLPLFLQQSANKGRSNQLGHLWRII